ncbi:hypothetical protein [Cellulomonas bogoriensis]|uniref:Membrane protein n=1 Tax=Cellulomonas bogoriensis 69B4 = DSM 16987 TaxID=1386082 RepID=A0A0A0BZJ7_9CELL|nr:hypothetical protein [Cellulomonas bogoriensis]KGM13122.1 membrane protein [Cellulomonas bogoriensis 69B4 = DSM 16987]
MLFDGIGDFFIRLLAFVGDLESWQQIGALLLVSAIPFIESYLGSFMGILVGIEPLVAVAVASVGNAVSTFLLIAGAARARAAVRNGRVDAGAPAPSKRRQKVARYMERFGVPGVSLLGPLALPSQFTGPTMVAIGASARSVYVWMGVSIIAWGVLFGFFSHLAVRWFG